MATIVNESGEARVDNRYRIPEDICKAIWACTKGCYQENLLHGREAWSGAGLSGKARDWAAQYQRSRDNLETRIDVALLGSGWAAQSDLVLKGTPRRWRRELVLTNPNGTDLVW